MNTKQIKRVIRFIDEEDLHKLGSYLKKHERKLLAHPVLLTDKMENVLHIACKLLKADSVRFLMMRLKQHITELLLAPNYKGNLPIHLAMKTVIKTEGSNFNLGYHDVVIPVLKACPSVLVVMNKRGDSVRCLLEKIEKKKEELATKSHVNSHMRDPSTGHAKEKSQEDLWNEKLMGECEDEYSMSWGQYEEDFTARDKQRDEHYDDWASRIQKEYNKKRKQEREKHYKFTKQPKEEAPKWTEEDQRNFEQMEHKLAKERSERKADDKFKKLKRDFASKLAAIEKLDVIRAKDMPFSVTDPSATAVMRLLTFDLTDNIDRESAVKLLKQKQVFWHPDKFAQKFGQRILEGDKEIVMRKVTEISQCLNTYEV